MSKKDGGMKHKSIFTLHKNINHSKYNKVIQTIFPKDITKEYDILKTGWRKKRFTE